MMKLEKPKIQTLLYCDYCPNDSPTCRKKWRKCKTYQLIRNQLMQTNVDDSTKKGEP